jgi:hypothetical protein
MRPTKKKYFMPKLVRKICGQFIGAWIVGGAAIPGVKEIKDWDIAVSFSEWQKVALLLPTENIRPSLFGGWKVTENGWDIDIWPSEIINIFHCSKCEWMWQPQLNIRIHREASESIRDIKAY